MTAPAQHERPGAAGPLLAHRLEIQYDGGAFHGWSKQPGLPTVEGALEEAFRIVTGTRPALTAAGRTDAGVHARRQVVSLLLEEGQNLERLSHSLQALTAPELAVVELVPAPGFDARRDARERTYRYFIQTGRTASPFLRRYSWHLPFPLDVAAMQSAATLVEGKHDFTAFTPTGTEHVFFYRTVNECRWDVQDGLLVLTISANAFLRQMVRSLVGTMVEMGRGRWRTERMRELLEGAPRGRAGPTCPARGLFLWDIAYSAGQGSRSRTEENIRKESIGLFGGLLP